MKGEVEGETRGREQQQKWTFELRKCVDLVFVFLSRIGLEPIWEETGPGRKRS